MRKKIVSILVMTLLIATTVTAVETTTEKENPIILKPHTFNTEVHKGTTEANTNGAVLWDNGMHLTCLVASQWDPSYPFDAIAADDFQFEETTVVTDVHWIGGYDSPGGDYDYDWNVSFYMDRGDDMAPGSKIYEQVFPNVDVHETFIEEIEMWDCWIFSYWVDLVDPITFTGGEKYWISIQGIGDYKPQSYWAGHFLPIVLHEGVFKSSYFGYYDWTDSSEVTGGKALHWCFQLTGEGEPAVPDLECDGDIIWDEVSPGAIVSSTFTVINNGDVGSMLEWEVLSYPNWGTNWSAKWIVDWLTWTDGGFVGTTTPEEIIVEVKAPDDPETEFTGDIVLVNSDDPDDTCTISVSLTTPVNQQVYNHPLLQKIFEQFPNAFTILRLLLKQ